MYISGRLRTASRPSRTWIMSTPYSAGGTGGVGRSVGCSLVFFDCSFCSSAISSLQGDDVAAGNFAPGAESVPVKRFICHRWPSTLDGTGSLYFWQCPAGFGRVPTMGLAARLGEAVH